MARPPWHASPCAGHVERCDVECGGSGLGPRRGSERHGRRLDLQERLVKVEVLVKNIHVHAGAVHVGGHGQAVREVDIGMGGSGRGGILAWTGSVGSRSSSSMARVGGEHLGVGAGVGVGILDCLIGHATTAAAAGAFPDSSAVPQSRSPAGGGEMSVPGAALACVARHLPLAACGCLPAAVAARVSLGVCLRLAWVRVVEKGVRSRRG